MSLKDDLWAYLNSTSGVTSVFSNASPDLVRIYPQVLPQDPTYPAATYQLIGRQRQPMVGGTTNDVIRSSIQMDVYADTSEGVDTGTAAIVGALKDFQGQWSGRQISRVLLENEIDLTDVEPGLFRNSMTFTIWHDEFVTSGSDYDGADYATRGAGLSGIADGKQGTVSVWVRIDGGDGSARNLLVALTAVGGATQRTRVHLNTTNNFRVAAQNAAATTVLDISSAGTYTAGPVWRHFLASWDLATGSKHIYINDHRDNFTDTTSTDDTIDYTHADWAVGGTAAGTLLFSGCIAELFFATAYIDLSVVANRRKFISSGGKPVNLGPTGALPLGVQPPLYAPDGNPSINLGSGGNFTMVGAPDTASTSPSD